jgi:hypothetical protein
MAHPFAWGLIVGVVGMYVYEHFGPTPKMSAGKYKA